MKTLDALKTEVKKDFYDTISSKAAEYTARLEKAAKEALFSAYSKDGDLSINTSLSYVTEVEVTPVIKELYRERPEVTAKTLEQVALYGYNIEQRTTTITKLIPSIPLKADRATRTLTAQDLSSASNTQFFLMLNP